jgi:hypothetical protein
MYTCFTATAVLLTYPPKYEGYCSDVSVCPSVNPPLPLNVRLGTEVFRAQSRETVKYGNVSCGDSEPRMTVHRANT